MAIAVTVPLIAQQRRPPGPLECGSRCGLVPDGQGAYLDCGPCPGICGDSICQPGVGETHATCPADCPSGPCQSEGCNGRCGLVRDQCGRLLLCGACPSSCGDGICDASEWIDCQADCGQQCRPRLNCGLRCGVVDDGCGSFIDCGACEGVCGNGLCETGETNADCPEDCAPAGCVSTGCNGGCGGMVDNCGRRLDCGRCGGYSQCPHPNGVCEPDLGEDDFNCKWECPIGCGDGMCSAAEPLRCPSDCAGGAPPDGISAGGPYSGVVDEPIHFFGAIASSVSTMSVEWSWGDGASATGANATHAYGAAGTYEVTFKVILGDGSVLRSLTSARVEEQAATNGLFHWDLEIHYDPIGDGISVTATIGPEGGNPPGSPKTPATYFEVVNPSGRVVHRTGWMPNVGTADPIFVRALAHPAAGPWRADALFGYVDAADPVPFIHPLGRLIRVALVPRQACTGCLIVNPASNSIRDGSTQSFTVGLSSPPPDSVAWSYSKPAGSSAAGAVDFTGAAHEVNAHATWFAQPDQACVAPSVLAEQAFRNAKYTIIAAAQTGSQLATGQSALTIEMPWGIAASLGGTQTAAVTLSPSLEGNITTSCPGSGSPCRISGHTLVRTAPTICWAETQDAICAATQQTYALMPSTSSFRSKVNVHETVHVHQYDAGGYYGDLWTIDGPNGLLSFPVPGRAVPLRDVTAPSRSELSALINASREAWRLWSTRETMARMPGAEPEAYAASDGVSPSYLLQGCNVIR